MKGRVGGKMTEREQKLEQALEHVQIALKGFHEAKFEHGGFLGMELDAHIKQALQQPVMYDTIVVCPTCRGTGKSDGKNTNDICPDCYGTGRERGLPFTLTDASGNTNKFMPHAEPVASTDTLLTDDEIDAIATGGEMESLRWVAVEQDIKTRKHTVDMMIDICWDAFGRAGNKIRFAEVVRNALRQVQP